MAEVCVLGLGYVGLPTASLLANAGVRVLGVDIDEKVVEAVKAGECRLGEPGLATMIRAAVRSGYLRVAGEPEASEVFVICVPTPVRDGHRVDLGAVESATRSIAPLLEEGNLVILESTSPIGTTRDVVGRILEGSGLEAGKDFDLCYCPERVLPGKTVGELINNDRIVGGTTQGGAQRARGLYERFSQGAIILTDDRTAEMVKLIENTYRDANIALANVFARIAEEAGVNVWEAIPLANRHPRVDIHAPGPGVGGHCLPVDPWFLAEGYPDHTALLREARQINDTQGRRLLDRIRATGKVTSGDRIASLGAAYKADIDDARGSPALLIAAAARGAGLEVTIHDPLLREREIEGFPVTNDLDECLEDAAAAVLVTEHITYRGLSPDDLLRTMKGRILADTRNCLDRAAFTQAGFDLIVTGRGR